MRIHSLRQSFPWPLNAARRGCMRGSHMPSFILNQEFWSRVQAKAKAEGNLRNNWPGVVSSPVPRRPRRARITRPRPRRRWSRSRPRLRRTLSLSATIGLRGGGGTSGRVRESSKSGYVRPAGQCVGDVFVGRRRHHSCRPRLRSGTAPPERSIAASMATGHRADCRREAARVLDQARRALPPLGCFN